MELRYAFGVPKGSDMEPDCRVPDEYRNVTSKRRLATFTCLTRLRILRRTLAKPGHEHARSPPLQDDRPLGDDWHNQ